MFGKENPIQQAMQFIERIDHVPERHTLIVYTKAGMTAGAFQQLRNVVETIRQDHNISIIAVPEDLIDIQLFSEEQRAALIAQIQNVKLTTN